jgi:hypothetical protein
MHGRVLEVGYGLHKKKFMCIMVSSMLYALGPGKIVDREIRVTAFCTSLLMVLLMMMKMMKTNKLSITHNYNIMGKREKKKRQLIPGDLCAALSKWTRS